MIARTTSPRRARHPHGELRERVGNYLSVKPPKVGNSLSADMLEPDDEIVGPTDDDHITVRPPPPPPVDPQVKDMVQV